MKKQLGFSLFEVMVVFSISVISFLLILYGHFQAKMLLDEVNTKNSYSRNALLVFFQIYENSKSILPLFSSDDALAINFLNNNNGLFFNSNGNISDDSCKDCFQLKTVKYPINEKEFRGLYQIFVCIQSPSDKKHECNIKSGFIGLLAE